MERSRNYARTFGKRSVGRIERGCPQPRSAHFRTDNTPDLRNGDKFQISQPRVVACSYIQLYICFTRPIEGRVRVLHLRISFETNGWNEASLDRASRDSCSLPRRWLHAHWGKGKKKVSDKETRAAVEGSISLSITLWCHPLFQRNSNLPEVCKVITLERFVRLTRIKITRKDWKIVLFNFQELETANNRRNNLKKKSTNWLFEELQFQRREIERKSLRLGFLSLGANFELEQAWTRFFQKTGAGGTLRKKRRNWAKQS